MGGSADLRMIKYKYIYIYRYRLYTHIFLRRLTFFDIHLDLQTPPTKQNHPNTSLYLPIHQLQPCQVAFTTSSQELHT